MDPHPVAVLVLDDTPPMNAGIPIQVFRERPGFPYTVRIAGTERGTVPSYPGLAFTVEHGLEVLAEAGTVLVTGPAHLGVPSDPRVITALLEAAERGTRIASICAGAFTLAEAGLLDGRRATTHWRLAGELASRHPAIEVDPNVLFVDEGQMLTSAGSAAGIDLCLHIVRQDLGVHAANRIAEDLVAPPYRSGGQAQFIPRIDAPKRGDLFADTRAWALDHLDEPIGVDDLARHARVSVRTFARRFTEDTGRTPMKWLMRVRIDAARELLETTDLGVERIAARVGLGTGANLRLHFRKILDTTPSEYRRAFTGRILGS